MRYLRAAAALAALLGLLAGIPATLAATVGDPLRAWPDLLAGDLSDRVVIAVMAAVAYLAWAQFALAVAVELAAGLARVRVPVRLPGVFAGQRQLAHALVAAAFLLTPATAIAAPAHPGTAVAAQAVATTPAVFTTTEQATAAEHDDRRAGPQQAPATTSYVIRGDGPGTYWDLAEHFLGDGTRWQEIWHLNSGRHQSDGEVMSSPGLLREGWTVLLPAGGPGQPPATDGRTGGEQVEVHRGDTLSGIAADHDVADWHRLWEANQGRPEPGNRRFVDPDVILPGWTLTVPAQAADPATPAAAGRTEAATPAPQPAPSTTSGPAVQDGALAPTPATATPSTVGNAPTGNPTHAPTVRERPQGEQAPAASVTGTDTARPTATASAGTSAPVTASAPPAAGEESDGAPAGMSVLAASVFGVGGLLLAGVSAQALRRHRRRQFRHRRPGRAIAATPPQLSGTQRALLSGAGVSDVRWLAQALRGLVHLQAGDPQACLPDVVAVRLTATDLELVLTGPHDGPAPGAWTVTGPAGDRWRLERGAPTGFSPAAADRHLAPYPALASVGYTADGDYWLVDLERVGALTLTGDGERCADLARFVAAELAHNTWSEQLQVSLVGFGRELVDLNPDRVEVLHDPGSALAAVAAQLRSVGAALDSLGVDVLEGRLGDVAADLWFPHVAVLSGPVPDDQLAGVLSAMQDRRGRAAVAVVVTGQDGAASGSRWQLHVDADGRLQIPALGLDLIAQQLPAHEAEQLAQLMAVAARTEDEPMPDAAGDAGWASYADLAGAPRTDLLTHAAAAPGEAPSPARHGGDSACAPVRADRVLPLPAAAYLDTTATTDADLAALAPAVNDEVRRHVTDADPTLEQDLAAWADPDCPRPKLRLLGPLAVSATRGELPAGRPRLAWNVEIVAYLACHGAGVTAEQFGRDLWPGDPDITGKAKVRQSIYIARRWLGADPVSGMEYLPAGLNPSGGTGIYRLEGVLVDADLFRRLRLRGVARGADGITDLQAALDLVTGPPFADPRPGGYAWLADDPLDHAYTGMIVDVAHVVATHYLATGRPDLAAAAAQVSLTAGSSDDIALLDLVAACDAQGNRAEADRLITRILANHDAEVEEDLPPRTAEVLHRRRWLDRAS
ncbi:MAG TPA: LysM peptidoglycan-binding domain-containing protein [Kineosporiaceae bacterium]|nr:LysM peptidoglycan-binding domain-containing protein [Kineosporiaceae bacterium]